MQMNHKKTILAIETSFDEAGLAVVEYEQDDSNTTTITVKSDVLFSQVKAHQKYGGVYPSLAKQIHAKNLPTLFIQALKDANLYKESHITLDTVVIKEIQDLLKREDEMCTQLIHLIESIEKPKLDAIAITHGPGLEPALWVGISFVKALSVAWNIPLSPVNHMEGHIAAALAQKKDDTTFTITQPKLPVLALLISGAHTELVLMKEWLTYERIGSTRDDAVGEAFDKTARLLGLPYPGGPEISRLARVAREHDLTRSFTLPRPMIASDDYDFSFSGLKTAVRQLVENIKNPTDKQKAQIAREFEDAVTDVLIAKTKKVVENYHIQTLIVSGGVAANKHITHALNELAKDDCLDFFVPTIDLATDNGRMIAFAATIRDCKTEEREKVEAIGNLKLY